MEERAKRAKEQHPGFLHRMSMYGLELFMALFGFVTTLVVVDYGVFALTNYIKGGSRLSSSFGELTIWVVSAMIVWIPVTLLFYLRVRNELAKNPAHEATVLHKVLSSIYYFSIIIGAIGLVFIAVYTAIRLAVMPDASVTDTVVRIIVPALVAVVFHVGLLFAFTRAKRPGKIMFSAAFGGISVAIAVALLVMSAGTIRAVKQDENTVSDLGAIQSAISSKTTTPANLSDVEQLSSDTKNRLSHYTYTKVDATRYTLCATFATDASELNGGSEMTPVSASSSYSGTDAEYQTYANFFGHKQGYQCYKFEVYTASMYDKPVTENTVTN